ncbi:acyl carrier protein [Anthocerotibacter panamensis]|uniref:acyl carrier protein n=1 Tax=Anthocerotibacter panamensis TaxID=2857077 RepID=UPI001C4020E6|nr:acyl carrier protein [Anthocerotibacter panamensis]
MPMPTKLEIESSFLSILEDMTQDWDLDVEEITSETQLAADLNFSSVDIIHLVVSTEEQFGRKLGLDQLLMSDGRYVDDLSVSQWVNFITQKLGGPS